MRSRSNWNLKVLVFEERRKTGVPEKNLSEQGREPTTNSTHMASTPGFEPRPHWWEASAFTTAAPMLPGGGFRPSGKGGGGSQKFFFALWASVWAQNKGSPAPRAPALDPLLIGILCSGLE